MTVEEGEGEGRDDHGHFGCLASTAMNEPSDSSTMSAVIDM